VPPPSPVPASAPPTPATVIVSVSIAPAALGSVIVTSAKGAIGASRMVGWSASAPVMTGGPGTVTTVPVDAALTLPAASIAVAVKV
jgi:hypothetical protein